MRRNVSLRGLHSLSGILNGLGDRGVEDRVNNLLINGQNGSLVVKVKGLVERVTVEIPARKPLALLTQRLGPWVSVNDGRVVDVEREGGSKDTNTESTSNNLVSHNSEGEVLPRADKTKENKVERAQVVVQEELSSHEVRGEVVQSPSKKEGGELDVVSSQIRSACKVVVSALESQQIDGLPQEEDTNREGSQPPDGSVTEKIDLSVILNPEVDTSLEEGPGLRSRLPGMGISKSLVDSPHDLVQLEELGQERGGSVRGSVSGIHESGVGVRLNVPDGVGKSSRLGASYLLLLKGPLGELDRVREQSTTSDGVDKSELGVDGSNTVPRDTLLGLGLDNLDSEVIIGITIETGVTVGGNLVLVVSLRHGGRKS